VGVAGRGDLAMMLLVEMVVLLELMGVALIPLGVGGVHRQRVELDRTPQVMEF
jgi:hypothetical protein